MKRAWIYLVVGALTLGFATKQAGVGVPDAPLVTGAVLSRTEPNTEVTVAIRVLELDRASDGRPLLVVETVDGYQARVYVADDARSPQLIPGSRYTLRVTVNGSLLTLLRPGAVRPLSDAEAHTVTAVVVGQRAYVQTPSGAYSVPAEGADTGVHTGTLVVSRHSRFLP